MRWLAGAVCLLAIGGYVYINEQDKATERYLVEGRSKERDVSLARLASTEVRYKEGVLNASSVQGDVKDDARVALAEYERAARKARKRLVLCPERVQEGRDVPDLKARARAVVPAARPSDRD